MKEIVIGHNLATSLRPESWYAEIVFIGPEFGDRHSPGVERWILGGRASQEQVQQDAESFVPPRGGIIL